jgi:DegV family protein with EDD domain
MNTKQGEPMSKIAIVTDSNSTISPSLAKELGVFVAPIQVNLEGKEYRDMIDIQPADVVDALKTHKSIKTSQPNIGFVEELFTQLKSEGYDHIIAISLSSVLSGTYQTFCLGAANAEVENMITIIDTMTTCGPCKQAVLVAKKMVDEGKSVEEIVNIVTIMVKDSKTYILPDNLEQLIHGGRVKGATALLGTLLKIKLLLSLDYAVPSIEKMDTSRTDVKLFQAVVDDMKARGNSPKTHKVFVPSCESFDRVEAFKNYLNEKAPGYEIEQIVLPAGIAGHTGFAFGVQPVLKG